MALLWMDGFDHYGATADMTDGAWAQMSNALSTANPRTGSKHMRYSGGHLAHARRVLGGPKQTVGVGCAFYPLTLPASNDTISLFSFRDAANNYQLTLVLQSTGILAVKLADAQGTLMAETAAPVMVAEAYQHVEMMVKFSQTVGWYEVRVNGVTVLAQSGVDTCATALEECSQISFGTKTSIGSIVQTLDMDDIFVYDDTGSYNNTFIGDRRVLTLRPNADTAVADWAVVGAASGYDAINDATPDGDTTYISTTAAGQMSEFAYEDLPSNIASVAAIQSVNMMRKTEAGTCNVQCSTVSGASVEGGADRPITEVYTYWHDVFETDPATAAPFTKAGVDALKLRLTRTA